LPRPNSLTPSQRSVRYRFRRVPRPSSWSCENSPQYCYAFHRSAQETVKSGVYATSRVYQVGSRAGGRPCESHGQGLTAFDIAPDGGLSGRRIWAKVDGPPDGICIDADGAVWYADVPNKHCVRVAEGGEVLEVVSVDRGCFACMLGGDDGRTLFALAATWGGMDNVDNAARTGQVLTAAAPAPGAGWP